MGEWFFKQDPEMDKEAELAKLLVVEMREQARKMASLADVWSPNHMIWPSK